MKQEIKKIMEKAGYKGDYELVSFIEMMKKDIGLRTIFFSDDGSCGCTCGTPFVGYVTGEKDVIDALGILWIRVTEVNNKSKEESKARKKKTEELKAKLEGWNKLGNISEV